MCTDKSMFGIFLKDFSQMATSQGYFPKWQLHKCAISQATTSHHSPPPHYSLFQPRHWAHPPLQPAANQRA